MTAVSCFSVVFFFFFTFCCSCVTVLFCAFFFFSYVTMIHCFAFFSWSSKVLDSFQPCEAAIVLLQLRLNGTTLKIILSYTPCHFSTFKEIVFKLWLNFQFTVTNLCNIIPQKRKKRQQEILSIQFVVVFIFIDFPLLQTRTHSHGHALYLSRARTK